MVKAASPKGEYEAGSYWSQRLGNDFSLVGVGYKALGSNFNKWQYKACLRNLERASKRFGFDLGSESILECGFGTGFFLDFYHRLGNRDFAGLDLTEVAVKNLKQRYPGAMFRQADLGAGPIDLGRKFDVATAFAVLLHITDDEHFRQALANVCEHSAKWVLLTEELPQTTFRAPGKSHYVLRSRGEIEAELNRHGFEVVGTEPVFVFLAGPTPRFKSWFYFWNAALYALTRTEFTGNLFGGLFYGVDGALISAFGCHPSVDLLVARRRTG
jgi:2-polyprenyl-3-methyl-5-hydroxy-6-metoxy-1,4-benzoquinol methylase